MANAKKRKLDLPSSQENLVQVLDGAVKEGTLSSHTLTSPFHRLPNELIELIFTHLLDSPKSLSSCAFVCRAWFSIIRRIFHSSRMKPGALRLPLAGFQVAFRPDTRYPLLAEGVWIRFQSRIWRRHVADAVADGQLDANTWAAQLVRVTANCRALSELMIGDVLHGWHIFPPSHPFLLVKELTLFAVHLNTSTLLDLLPRFRCLEVLNIAYFTWDDPHPTSSVQLYATPESFSPDLKTLVVGGMVDASVYYLGPWIHPARGLAAFINEPGSIKFPNVRFEGRYTFQDIMDVTQSLGASLQQLQLCMLDLDSDILVELANSSSLVRVDIVGVRILNEVTYVFDSIVDMLLSLPNPGVFRELRLYLVGVDPRMVGIYDLKVLDKALALPQFANFQLLRIRYSLSMDCAARNPHPGIKYAVWEALANCYKRGIVQLVYDKEAFQFQPEPFSVL